MLRLTFVLLLFTTQALAQPADVLLTNATIYDGISTSPATGDVAIHNGSIVAVGKMLPHTATLEIDCTDKILCPGFIDLHNHSDRQIVVEATRANVNYLLQGCTTVVTGNCGSGPVDVAKYYEQINNAGAGTNIAHLLPQGGLRLAVMGSERREPTEKELEEMLTLAEKAMQDGAWGMSTGLIYVPALMPIPKNWWPLQRSSVNMAGSMLVISVEKVAYYLIPFRKQWILANKQACQSIFLILNRAGKITGDWYVWR